MTASDAEIGDEYHRSRSTYEHLESEVAFALKQALRDAGIKTHSVTSRVKDLQSVLAKVGRKGYLDPLNEIEDFVGARVVCLFLSDLPRVDELLRGTFEVDASEDKVEGGEADAFGYMSHHYMCRIKSSHTGPRYDHIKDLGFEVQVRTILMDAWANVSHYLAYKGEMSIPERLRRDFYALSGLFHIADQHFQLFFSESLKEQNVAAEQLRRHEGGGNESIGLNLNLETMVSFLQGRYPDRSHTDRATVAELVDELIDFGYGDTAELAAKLDAGDSKFLRYERKVLHSGGQLSIPGYDERFADVAAVRLTLAASDEKYHDAKYGKPGIYPRRPARKSKPSAKAASLNQSKPPD